MDDRRLGIEIGDDADLFNGCEIIRGLGGSNAIPGAPMKKFIGDVSGKVVNLADIYRVPKQGA